MRRSLVLISGLIAGLAAAVPALAAPPGVINQYNALCDWRNPAHCVAVDANGAIIVTGAGGGGALMLDATGQSILSAVQGPIPTQAPTVSIGGVGVIPSSDASVGISPVVTGSAGTGQVIKAGAGNLYSIEVQSGASAGYVMVHDAVAVPAAGAVTPKKCYALAANSAIGVTYNPPIVMATGISVSFSTTGCFTQTDSATAFISGEAK